MRGTLEVALKANLHPRHQHCTDEARRPKHYCLQFVIYIYIYIYMDRYRLSKLITECLNLVRSHCTTYCKTIRERTGVNSMWIINNVLDAIRTLEEKQLSLTRVSTWDFSTLYTSSSQRQYLHGSVGWIIAPVSRGHGFQPR